MIGNFTLAHGGLSGFKILANSTVFWPFIRLLLLNYMCYLRRNFKHYIKGTCVASNSRSSGTAALRYASALVDLAAEQNTIPQIEKDVADMQAMIADSADLQALIRSPLVKAYAAGEAMAAIATAAKFSQLFGNFLLTLIFGGTAGGIVWQLIIAIVGACLLIAIVRAISGGRQGVA